MEGRVIISIFLFLPFAWGATLRVNGLGSTTEIYNGIAPKSHDKRNSDYGYSYGVSDPSTGDHKNQWEKRENGVVSGAYSLLEPDGSTRLVQYRADDTGFHPYVQRLPAQSVSSLQYPSSTSSPYYTRGSINRDNAYYNPRPYQNTGYNYNGRYYFPDTASYRPSPSNFDKDYRSGHLNSYSGYDSSYRGSDLGPYNLGINRQRGQGVPLLHSTYHGYDNLYH